MNTTGSTSMQPIVTADIVLISANQQVLLILRRKWPFADTWALPGGKLNQDESLEETAQRELREETGVEEVTLKQFHTYSDPGRDPRGHYVSTVFVARVETTGTVAVQADDDAKEARWFPLSDLPELAFDHATILHDIMQEQPLLTEHAYTQEILRTYAGSDERRDKLCFGVLGLAGESGEVVDLVKKYLYQGHEIDRATLRDELGDVLWYFALICHAAGYSLKEVMHHNVEKLRKRYPHGFAAQRSMHRNSEQEESPGELVELDPDNYPFAPAKRIDADQ